MRALVCNVAVAVLLVGCTQPDSSGEPWQAEVARAISQAELGLRYWCDPGTPVKAIRDSAEQLRYSLRTSAGSVRSMMIESQTDEGADEHETLIALADFAAVAYDMGARATSEVYVRPGMESSDLRYVSPTLRASAFERASFEEREAARLSGGGDELIRRELLAMQKEQAQAFHAAVDELQTRLVGVRQLESAAKEDGNSIGLDVAVVDRAAQCLGAKLGPLYRPQ